MIVESSSQHILVSQLQGLLVDGAVSTERARIAASASTNPSLPAGLTPVCVVQPGSTDELLALIRFANESDLNLVVTSSSGAHRNGGIACTGEHVLVDLSHWRKIDLIDRRNRVCRIEPGVTYGELAAALAEHGLAAPSPIAPRDGKSVLASVMDREPTTWPNRHWDASDPAGSTAFFFGNGECFRSGAAGGPGTIEQQRRSGGAQKFSSGPSQTDFHRIIQGAQGTMGIVTWITLRVELKPSVQKSLIAGSKRLEDLLPFVYAVQRGLLGEQTFILDRTASAMLLAGGDPDAFQRFRSACPAFICLQNVAGFERLPQERLAFHLEDIQALASKHGLQLEEQVGPVTAADLLNRATQPCGEIDWRDRLRGSSLSIFFLSTLDHSPAFLDIVRQVAMELDIGETDIGVYIQPVVQNHACHVEFILPFDRDSEKVVERARQFESQAVIRLMEAGAFFSRPYGSAGDLVWAQNPANYELVKVVKQIFDPNRVLQRGKWGL